MPRRHARPLVTAIALTTLPAWALVACTPVIDAPVCSGTGAVGEVVELATGFKGTEGIAFSDDGRLFVSSDGAIVEILPDGSTKPFATVPAPLGIAWWNGALYVASGSDGETEGAFDFCADDRPGAVWRVSQDGTAEVFATGIRAPNFLAVTPWDTLLVSDDCPSRDRLYELTADAKTRPWVDGVPSPNGLAFGPGGTELFAATTFVNPPPLWRVPVLDGGRAGTPAEFVGLPDRGLPDGIAVDRDGAVYVAVNAHSLVQRVSPDGDTDVLAEDLLTVASLAFGVGDDFDACSLYATSLLGDTVYRIHVGVPGLPLHR